MYTDLYTTTSQSNYQITANNQYVTGYDQSGKIYSNQNSTSYGGHPGYTYNQNSGTYSYGSGYQVSLDLSISVIFDKKIFFILQGSRSNVNS